MNGKKARAQPKNDCDYLGPERSVRGSQAKLLRLAVTPDHEGVGSSGRSWANVFSTAIESCDLVRHRLAVERNDLVIVSQQGRVSRGQTVSQRALVRSHGLKPHPEELDLNESDTS